MNDHVELLESLTAEEKFATEQFDAARRGAALWQNRLEDIRVKKQFLLELSQTHMLMKKDGDAGTSDSPLLEATQGG